MAMHGLATGLILTENEAFDDEVDGRRILVRPAWKWLLDAA